MNEEGSVSSSLPSSKKNNAIKKKDAKNHQEEYCAPDDIITHVKVGYSGDYVLSQLLQWYNGGIGQKPGLPDMTGCVILPAMSGCWTDKDIAKEVKLVKWKKSRITNYSAEVRPMLIDWLEDRFKRGNPWSDEIASFFGISAENENVERQIGSESAWQCPMGSPVVDFLVTGDDTSIIQVLHALRKQDSEVSAKRGLCETILKPDSAVDSLHSTVDEGMPVQAVANWVQCENPNCLKWRKLPWHVDTDLLPENFFCKDNVWNPGSNSCDSPEDVWDEDDALVKSGDTRAEMAESSFIPGARFDVLQGRKNKYYEGEVVEVDFMSEVKRVKFYFPRMKNNFDEWIDLNSGRIAPLNSYTEPILNGSTSLSAARKQTKSKDSRQKAVQPEEEDIMVVKKPKKLKAKSSGNKSAKKALFTDRESIVNRDQQIDQTRGKIPKKKKKNKVKYKTESNVTTDSTDTKEERFQSLTTTEEAPRSGIMYAEAQFESTKRSEVSFTEQSYEGKRKIELTAAQQLGQVKGAVLNKTKKKSKRKNQTTNNNTVTKEQQWSNLATTEKAPCSAAMHNEAQFDTVTRSDFSSNEQSNEVKRKKSKVAKRSKESSKVGKARKTVPEASRIAGEKLSESVSSKRNNTARSCDAQIRTLAHDDSKNDVHPFFSQFKKIVEEKKSKKFKGPKETSI
mmetsp:Transcript_29626/g.43112  ORF Transcript_29626/g.43112 Transcript_29626/m.43112 type:complete len:679 (+) Transcript_29626:2-2038(+)